MTAFYITFGTLLGVILLAYGVLKFVFASKCFAGKISCEKREKFDKCTNKILKICVVIYCTFMILAILLPDAFVRSYSDHDITHSYKDITFAIVRWFGTLTFVMLPLAIFFKNRTIRNITTYFCLSMTIVSVFFAPTFLEYFTSTAGCGLNSIGFLSNSFKQFLINPTFRGVLFGIQLGGEFSMILIFAIQEKHIFNFKSAKEYLTFFAVLIPALLGCLPIYVPQHLFGYSNIIFKAWSLPHIIWVVSVIGIIIALYFIFRKKSYENKMILLFFLSLCLVMQYCQMFGAVSIKMKRLPLQLCNLGAFFILFSLITKSKRLFNFTVIVNVVGVLFALAYPDLEGEGLFYLYNMHFIFEHTNVIVVPILALLFNIFPRLDKHSLKDCLIGFSIYFVAVLVLGTAFNTIASITGNAFWNANYLFMFDQQVAGGFIEFLGKLFVPQIHIGEHITFYPVAQLVVYAVFMIVCTLLYFAIQLIYRLKDKIIKKSSDTPISQDQSNGA